MSSIQKRDRHEADCFIWNSIGGTLNAGQSVLILMVITRTAGLAAAGVFSIAYATGNLFLYFGEYGVRNYQVSDIHEQHSFRDYLVQRISTIALMMLMAIVYCIFTLVTGRYSPEKAATVFAMCLLKAIDCFEEVYQGRLHQRGRLDLAGKWMTLRILVSLAGMIFGLVTTGSLLVSIWIAFFLALGVTVFMIIRTRDTVHLTKVFHGAPGVLSLYRACFPVCAVNVLYFYLTNAPKYAIDAVMDEAVQAQYNFIAMPVFVVLLLSQFLYQPVLVKMTTTWQSGQKKAYLTLFLKIIGAILLASAVCLVGAWFLGIPVLSVLYATDLSALKEDLMWILVGGMFLGLNGFHNAVLTLMRCQRWIPAVYLAGTILSLILTRRMVSLDGIRGAVLSYVLIMVLIFVLLSLVFAVMYRRGWKKESKAAAC